MTVLGPPIWPLPTPSQAFRARGVRGPTDGGHNGTDWPSPRGTPLHAMSDGVVVETGGPDVESGNYVIVRADDGRTQWSFSHMTSPSSARRGARVIEGEVLGTVGMTGHTTGPHVHVTTRVGGVTVDAESITDPSRRGPGAELGGGDGFPWLKVAGVGLAGWGLWRVFR